jgi:hypothetical protein
MERGWRLRADRPGGQFGLWEGQEASAGAPDLDTGAPGPDRDRPGGQLGLMMGQDARWTALPGGAGAVASRRVVRSRTGARHSAQARLSA